MKNLITIMILIVAFGCSKSLKEEDVVGSYERKEDEHTSKVVLLENGKVGDSHNWPLAVWKILEKEVHIVLGSDAKYVSVFKIESNGDLTGVVKRERPDDDGNSSELPHEPTKYDKITLKKLKE